jgi:hypothetical protein
VAVGTINGGARWLNQKLPAGIFRLEAITCVAVPAACFAAGDSSANQGLIVVYR